jgi:hypothetical protein
MVVANADGVLSTQAIPSGGGGGSVGTIDQVLAAGNTAVNKTMQIQGGQISFADEYGTYVGNIKCEPAGANPYLSITSNTSREIRINANQNLLLLANELIVLGYGYTSKPIAMNSTLYNFYDQAQNSGSGENPNEWGVNFNQAVPQAGDRILFYFDGTRFVPSHIRTYAGAGGKTYLTID